MAAIWVFINGAVFGYAAVCHRLAEQVVRGVEIINGLLNVEPARRGRQRRPARIRNIAGFDCIHRLFQFRDIAEHLPQCDDAVVE